MEMSQLRYVIPLVSSGENNSWPRLVFVNSVACLHGGVWTGRCEFPDGSVYRKVKNSQLWFRSFLRSLFERGSNDCTFLEDLLSLIEISMSHTDLGSLLLCSVSPHVYKGKAPQPPPLYQLQGPYSDICHG